ncbi:MAG: XRE family transcriptional regulator [Thaumarchaeota archaeon]|nr:XRE family transcriptional regulator [Nitrososphaerota archaeon]
MLKEEMASNDLELIKSGQNFLGILNDIKRRPEDAAKELNISLDEINAIISGKKALSQEIVERAARIWPVNARDFFIIRDDCPIGVKIMTAEESKKSSRIMNRAGKPYYEYRDTAMSTTAPFRPEWILELCYVDDNDPSNSAVQWNNGHFMHQFTYFIGEVNFYYRSQNGEKKIAVMNTGDSMYITPFTSHTFTTRKGAKQNGLILALTYGSKLTGDIQQELSALSVSLGSEFALDFSTKQNASASLIRFHREVANLSLDELSKRTGISKSQLEGFEKAINIPAFDQTEKIAHAIGVSIRDLLPNDTIDDKVIVKHHDDGKKWYYPESTKAYLFVDLASTTSLPYSKAFEVEVLDSNNNDLDLRAGSHQYVYNVGQTPITLTWEFDGVRHSKKLNPDDSAYVKPFVKHNFRGQGKLLILRIGGKISGDSQRELSFVGKENAKRAIAETMQWFDPKGKN